MLWIAASVRYRYHKRDPLAPDAGSHNPMKGAKMRLSSLAMCLGGLVVLSLAVLVGVSSAHSSARGGQGSLTIATVNNGDMIVMQSLTSAFTKKYGIKVKYVTLPENTLRQKVTSDVATGGGQFDIATVGTYEVPIWAKNKWIVNLQPYLSKMSPAASSAYKLSDVIQKVRLGLSYKKNLYALPFYGESSMTYYNKKLFRAAGLKMPLRPTWTQVKSFAAKLNKPSANRYGICLRALPGWGEFGAPLTTVINTFGGSWFNMKWEPQLTSPATTKAVKFYVDLVRKYGEPGATSSGFTECETAMAQGRTAMWVDATVATGQSYIRLVAVLAGTELDVALSRRPGQELERGVLVLARRLHRQRPRPQPVRAARRHRRRGIREADVLRNLRLLRVGQLACRDRGIDPHGRPALRHRGLALGEAATRRAGLAV